LPGNSRTIFGLPDPIKFNIQKYQPNENQKKASHMTTPKLTQRLTISPSYKKHPAVTLFNLKPIMRRIKQVIGEFDVKHTNIEMTVTTKKIDAITFDITICVQGPPRPPDETPTHPPKKAFLVEG
jgi:hypothetical protein